MSGPLDHLPATLPAWAQPNEDVPVGVDYLGTRQANLDMLRELTGVYNNQVRSARQHAILAWAAWRFGQNVARREDVRPSEFIAFLEMIETIQLIGQYEVAEEVGAVAGGLGSGSRQHIPPSGPVPLRFADYHRTRETSALAAVQYGPSARLAGLGFLLDVGGVTVATKDRGLGLALALDAQLRRSAHYQVLVQDPPPETLAREAVLDLARHGLVLPSGDGLPRPERVPYVQALFSLDGHVPGDRRPETLALFLHTINALGEENGADEDDLRAHFLAWTSARSSVPAALVPALHRWQLFEARQLQRFALESWLALVERWMYVGIASAVDMVSEIERAFSREADLANLITRPAGRAFEGWAEPLSWARSREPWELVRGGVIAALHSGDLPAAINASARLHLGTLALARAVVPPSGELLTFAATGGRLRISLPEELRWWQRREPWSLREVLGELLEEHILQQHVGIAVSRFDNNQRRLRFSPGEEGWTLLPGTVPSSPGLTPDRIGASLALLEDVDLVKAVGGEPSRPAYRITPEGRSILARVLARGTA